jgi:hypothetical protein
MMVLVDIESKWAGGWSVGPSRNRHMYMEAVESLREGMASVGRCALSGVIVHHDRDSVYTSHAHGLRGYWWRRGHGFPMPREGGEGQSLDRVLGLGPL